MIQNLINTLYYIVPFLCILGLLVFAHELGHYWAARRAGMRVHEFAIGMGPVLWSIRKKFEENGRMDETLWSIRAIPLGGFVRIAGMEPSEDPHEPGGFDTKPWGWRFVTLIAGCVMNFALAAILFCILGVFIGYPKGVDNVVGSVVPNYPAAKAGLKSGDEIVGVGGVPTTDIERIRRTIEEHPGEALQLTIMRDGQSRTFTLTPSAEKEGEKKVGRIGVQFKPIRERVNPATALVMGVQSTYEASKGMLFGLYALATRKISGDVVGGPVMIVQQTGEMAKSGIPSLIEFTALLSINLGFINLLPFPALDGGRLIFLILQLFRVRVDPRKEAYVHAMGMLVLLFFIIVITYRDIQRWLNL